MALRISFLIILSSAKFSLGSLVLPRPPSSPNEIQTDIFGDSKNSRANRGSGSATNVEKPNTDGYRLLEIELSGGASAGGTLDLAEIFREVLHDGKNRYKIKEKDANRPGKFYYLKEGRLVPRVSSRIAQESSYLGYSNAASGISGKRSRRYNAESNHQHTTENSLATSSELPKQIPPPPSRMPSLTIFAHTTPVLKFMSRRTDVLPGYQ